MLPLIDGRDLLKISYADYRKTSEETRQRDIVLARQYHDGFQHTELPLRLRMFIKSANLGHTFALNACRSVISAVTERLSVIGFDSADQGLIEWAEQVWDVNRLAAIQDDIYEMSLRDGEAFVIIGWNEIEQTVRITAHPRFVDVGVGGDGYGCIAHYVQNDPNQGLDYAEKLWSEEIGGELIRRRNVYRADRIEKYRMDDHGEWVAFQDPRDPAWPLPWVDATGKPLGIAVIPFVNKGLRCEAWDAIPIQDAINKELIDLLVAADQTAFRVYVALGFVPTTDGQPPKPDRSNWQTVEPGQIVATTQSASEASFQAIQGEDLTPLQNLVHQLIMWLAMVTETPITRFTTTKLVASDETLKEQENPLLSRVRVRQVLYGTAWVQCFQLSRKLNNLWGASFLNINSPFQVLWREAQIRGETEKLDNLIRKQSLGVPRTQLWKEAGYSQDIINQMTQEMQNDDREPGRDAPTD